MAAEREAAWLIDDCEFSLAELAEISGLPEAELVELVELGAIAPADPGASPWTFKGPCLVTVRAALRLRASFELEPHGVALVMSLLDRIHELQAELVRARAQLPRRR
jgi:chaperone modulatory protein CbpM